MPKKLHNSRKLQQKDTRFLIYHYSEGKTLGESYNLATGQNIELNKAHQRGFKWKVMLESIEDYREIFRQFAPNPVLAAHISDVAFKSKDPNLRHKGQLHLTRVLGMQEQAPPEMGGFAINIGAAVAVQVTAGDPQDQEPGADQKRLKDGKPKTFLK